MDDLPPEYDGEEWKDVNVQEYYSKVKEAQDINKWISEAKGLQENYNSKVESIRANEENKKSSITLKYNTEREDIKDLIELSKSKIEKANNSIENADRELDLTIRELENKINREKEGTYQAYLRDIKALEEEMKKRKANLDETYKFAAEAIENSLKEGIDRAKKDSIEMVSEQKDLISIHKSKIAVKEQELIGLEDKEIAEKEVVANSATSEVEKEKLRIGKASKYLEEHEEIDVEPLQEEANKVQEMVSYLREWNRISEIRDNQLAPKEQYSSLLTERINKARNLPGELLKTAKMPIEGISVDENGLVRINGTLIDGLSEGEKLSLAMKVAKAQCGELKVICLDSFECLDKESQERLLKEMFEDEYQYFVTEVAKTESGKVELEKIGEVS